MRRASVLLLACAAALLGGGCGEEGASSGATVSVYAVGPLCAAAKRELARQGDDAGGLRVRARCLDDARRGGEISLAATGANARNATEDSTAVAYLEAPGPASRFSRPIVEAAGIGVVYSDSGEAAMARVLRAIGSADHSSLRASVRDSLD